MKFAPDLPLFIGNVIALRKMLEKCSNSVSDVTFKGIASKTLGIYRNVV